MTKRTTISIPDELHERMEKWKGKLNFSRISQNAISDAIRKRENFKKRLKEDENMEQIIERLQKEKKESEEDVFEAGKLEGLDWAKYAHYDEIQLVLNAWDSQEGAIAEIMKHDTSESNWTWLSKTLSDFGLEYEDSIPFRTFESGFVKGVEEFWDEVKNEIQ